jgi:hypothetical protein
MASYLGKRLSPADADPAKLGDSWAISLVAANRIREGGHPLELTRARAQRYIAVLTPAGKQANSGEVSK